MEIIEIVLLILLVVVCLALGALVLIQQGRGSDIGAAFGSGAANTVFGSGGATPFLVKFTAMLAIGFFAVTFSLAYTAKKKSEDTYPFGDVPQANEESLDDLLIPSDEDLLPTDETDTPSSPEGDLLPTDDDSDNSGDILEQLLEEDSDNDTPTPSEDDAEEGDRLPDL
ncbi:MAG: preprotein translocase subunit SecG [Gammaproteobacteria bacterium]|nr:preprotein translocase subunit SecG [Gammaproteobacteria bacterium]MYF03385.1 preprotein translocase subunit SecG [Gammaproteobacteria bacterium]MYI78063.1 preprotein translocase subunit SecG [Gammaproteobacteria bacterium]